MFKRILVPLDGSARAESALPVAARLAHAYGASIELLKVVEAYAEYGAYLQSMLDEEKLEATRYLEKVAKSVELEGIEVEVNVMLGQVGKSIIAAAQASHASLIVLCSHGYSSMKRWMLGSVAEKVARHAPVPVFILREGATIFPTSLDRPVRALVPLDGSPFSEEVFEPASYLVAGLASSTSQSGELRLLRVIDLPMTSGALRSQANISPLTEEQVRQRAQDYLKGLIERLDESDLAELNIAATASIERNPDVTEAIIHEAEGRGSDRYDLIAMATHGRSGAEHFMMGSVTERLLHTTKLPLLVVRPKKIQARHEEAGKKEESKIEVMEEGAQSWTGLF